MMCAPLIDSTGRALGAMQIDTLDQRSRFQQDDLDVLVSVASQAAFALENAQLHEAALRQQTLERDLQLAHKVQQGFLPAAPPRIAGYDFFDFYEAANQVGGDYFDYVPLSGNRLGMVLADVSGKGISAAS
jgi:serine phosphatase RsbU (regulator of sigma subunit)